jgi:hypothetical protein
MNKGGIPQSAMRRKADSPVSSHPVFSQKGCTLGDYSWYETTDMECPIAVYDEFPYRDAAIKSGK